LEIFIDSLGCRLEIDIQIKYTGVYICAPDNISGNLAWDNDSQIKVTNSIKKSVEKKRKEKKTQSNVLIK
jgi:hypothetical protein